MMNLNSVTRECIAETFDTLSPPLCRARRPPGPATRHAKHDASWRPRFLPGSCGARLWHGGRPAAPDGRTHHFTTLYRRAPTKSGPGEQRDQLDKERTPNTTQRTHRGAQVTVPIGFLGHRLGGRSGVPEALHSHYMAMAPAFQMATSVGCALMVSANAFVFEQTADKSWSDRRSGCLHVSDRSAAVPDQAL
jgi:hypothetical protein